ncbi:MAG: menaquinone biosynthesis protein [Gemmatimonadaceae bacterium]|nr:menaquinone biosynthesis protein [Chitinophagaceae bacterium]
MSIKAGAVSYLNTKPLIYGFEQGRMNGSVELIQDYPARVASMLVDDEIDIGLVPVAIIPKLNSSHIIGDYCIGCDGPVASVCLFSDVPMHEVKEVLLDYQSRTSVRLAKILIKEYWQIDPVFTDTSSDFRDRIKGKTAGLVIGDRAFEQRKISPYQFDLGEAWKNHTGLPFVFAAWISNKKLPDDLMAAFNETTGVGFDHLQEIVAANPYPLFNLMQYFTENVSYKLDSEKRKGLAAFLAKINEHNL